MASVAAPVVAPGMCGETTEARASCAPVAPSAHTAHPSSYKAELRADRQPRGPTTRRVLRLGSCGISARGRPRPALAVRNVFRLWCARPIWRPASRSASVCVRAMRRPGGPRTCRARRRDLAQPPRRLRGCLLPSRPARECRCQVVCVRGWPCSGTAGGPSPPCRARSVTSPTSTYSSLKPSNTSYSDSDKIGMRGEAGPPHWTPDRSRLSAPSDVEDRVAWS